MKGVIVVIVVLISVVNSVASATSVVFDTIGPTLEYNRAFNSLYIGGGGTNTDSSGNGYGQRAALPFTPDQPGQLASVELPVVYTKSNLLYNGSVTISLFSDNNGEIGPLLEIIDSGSPWPVSDQVVQFDSTNNTSLVAGTQYWIVAEAPLDDLGDYGWLADVNEGVPGYAFCSEGAGEWNDWRYISTQTRVSARVSILESGNVVPLPAAVWAGLPLLGGMFGVKVFRRRKA